MPDTAGLSAPFEVREYERELRVQKATIRETHHRVKNNFQTIKSLLHMQMRRTKSPEVGKALSEAIARIDAMVVTHEMLSNSPHEGIDALVMARAIAQQVKNGLVGKNSMIEVAVAGQASVLNVPMISNFALALTEIIHNALEHGLKNRNFGTVEVRFFQNAGMLVCVIEDDGCGLPKEFSLETTTGMGLLLVRTLVEDGLSGSIAYGPAKRHGGARFTLKVPMEVDDGDV
jgi:two-component sensor histidine kinase